jgi:hypothetical protein
VNDIDKIAAHVHKVRTDAKSVSRDARQLKMRLARAGNYELIAPDAFSQDWPKPIIANFLQSAAMDMAESLAPLPSLTCASGSMVSESAKERASKRQKIGANYWEQSKLAKFSVNAADWFFTAGFLPILVEPDFDRGLPMIRFDDPYMAYPEVDRYGTCHTYTKVLRYTARELANMFPEQESRLCYDRYGRDVSTVEVEVVRFTDKHCTVMYAANVDTGYGKKENILLTSADNRCGRTPVAIAQRASLDGQWRGQYDDAIWVQIARAKMASLALEAGMKAVEAPMAVPEDMVEFAIGPDAVLRTQSPEKIRRISMEVPQSAFAMDQRLDMEAMRSTRYPEARSGNISASVITGRGVQELMGSFDSMISTAQTQLGDALAEATSIAFEMDEKCFGGVSKKIVGISAGAPYELTYDPAKAINGAYECEVTYGLMAGLAPNNAVVMMLQLLGAGLVSKESVQRQLPFDVDPIEMNRAITMERGRDAMLEGIAAYAQSIPAQAAQGMDPRMAVQQIATFIEKVAAGDAVERAALAAFTPPEPTPEEQAAAEAEAAMLGGGGPGLPPGLGPDGLMAGVAPGQAGMAPGGLPDVASMIASFRGGRPELSASVQTRRAIP